MSTIDQQFVEYIIKSLVEHPDDVVVERLIDEKGVLLTLTVNPEALGTKNDARYNLKIVNNDGFTGAQSSEGSASSSSAVEKPTEEAVESQSSYAENARKELAELDDLDI